MGVHDGCAGLARVRTTQRKRWAGEYAKQCMRSNACGGARVLPVRTLPMSAPSSPREESTYRIHAKNTVGSWKLGTRSPSPMLIIGERGERGGRGKRGERGERGER
jgi:hypothetical protein